jgi:hypothetical protein
MTNIATLPAPENETDELLVAALRLYEKSRHSHELLMGKDGHANGIEAVLMLARNVMVMKTLQALGLSGAIAKDALYKISFTPVDLNTAASAMENTRALLAIFGDKTLD